MSDSDAIGYIYRDEEENLMISFKSNDALEAGSRSPHLRGQVLPFDWNKIYVKENK
jgi:hypothetical protein